MRSSTVAALLALALVVLGANANLVPYGLCWENDLQSAGGVLFYVGAQSSYNVPTDMPTGPLNYMNGANTPPTLFQPGWNGYLRHYSFANPPATLTWVIGDSESTMQHMMITSNIPAYQCNATNPVQVTIAYNAAASVLPSLNQQTIGTVLAFQIQQHVAHYPQSLIVNPVFAATPFGFTVTLTINPNVGGSVSQYYVASYLAGHANAGEANSLTADLVSAITNNGGVNISYVNSPDTVSNAIPGTPNPPTAPVSPTPVTIPPGALPENPVIPFADCWERNGSNIWFYFGYNNTNNYAVTVDNPNLNFVAAADGSSHLPTYTFNPGFSGFAFAVPVRVPINQNSHVEWYLLNYQVLSMTVGERQHCQTQSSVVAYINFYSHSIMPANPHTIIHPLTNLILSEVPGANAGQLNVIINEGVTPWRIEIEVLRGPVSQYMAVWNLYKAFYNNPAFASQIEQLLGTAPRSLQVHPTITELEGQPRPAPVFPVAPSPQPPTSQPIHISPPSGLSGGAVFGIIVGVGACIAVFVGAFWWYRKYHVGGAAQGGFEKLIQ